MAESKAEQEYRLLRKEYLPWECTDADIDAEENQSRLNILRKLAGATIAEHVYIAKGARIFTESLCVGAGTYIGSDALLRGDIFLGENCSVNPYSCLSGKVVCGESVRIASGVNIVGFNHRFERNDIPVFRQGISCQGITIHNDVWIGANAVILDGAEIGHGVIVAAGSVVRGKIPDFAIIGGVPAKIIRFRAPAISDSLRVKSEKQLDKFSFSLSLQWREIISANNEHGVFTSYNAAGEKTRSLRNICDAIEIASGFSEAEKMFDVPALAAKLNSYQNSQTGLYSFSGESYSFKPDYSYSDESLYNILSVGYALECLNSHPAYPIKILDIDAQQLISWIEKLPWKDNPWGAGAGIDAIATGIFFNMKYFNDFLQNRKGLPEALFGWLALNNNKTTGLWGNDSSEDLLLPVNGFYRLTRGSYDQYGVPLPRPEYATDSIIRNYYYHNEFKDNFNACNVLDTLHPLFLCLQHGNYRRQDAEKIAGHLLPEILEMWVDNQGFPFARGQRPGLQGTEMWLSVIAIITRILNAESLFPFQPKGVHRIHYQ